MGHHAEGKGGTSLTLNFKASCKLQVSYKSIPATGDPSILKGYSLRLSRIFKVKNTITVHNYFFQNSVIRNEKKKEKWFLQTLNGPTNTRPKSCIKLFEG